MTCPRYIPSKQNFLKKEKGKLKILKGFWHGPIRT
jgi:hypothetical protein